MARPVPPIGAAAAAPLALLLAILAAAPGVAHVAIDEQIAELTRRIEADPGDASLYLRRGELRRLHGEHGAARADYETARRLEPAMAAVDLCLGTLLLEAGRPDEAAAALDAFLNRRPDDPEGLAARGRARTRLGRHLEAAEDFTRAIAQHREPASPRPELYLERARALSAAGDAWLEEALRGLEQGAERLGRPVALVLAAAEIERRAGRPADARQRLESVGPHAAGAAARAAFRDPEVAAAQVAARASEVAAARVATRAPHGTAPPPAASPTRPLAAAGSPAVAAAGQVLVAFGSPMRYLASTADPGLGAEWADPAFDDSAWPEGRYGVGYETLAGARDLLLTPVAPQTRSVYTRARFTIEDLSRVESFLLGADYDDGYAVWLNGVLVHFTFGLGPLTPAWNAPAPQHESGNGPLPDYGDPVDLTQRGLPLLRQGENVLAVGVWNSRLPSTDLVLVPWLSTNSPVSIVRGPYLQMGTHEGIVLRWRTDRSSDAVVRYGLDPDDLPFEASDGRLVRDHEVVLSGLLPETRYVYTAGTSTQTIAGVAGDLSFVTGPPPGARRPTRVWVIGDSGTADANAARVRDAYESFTGGRRTDLWLMLGDNAYPDGTDGQYQSAVFDMYRDLLARSALWPTLGNHDGHTADSTTQSGPYYDIFTLPSAGQAGGLPSGTEAYYSFDHANVHFICLESHETDRSPDGAMMTWLREDAMSTTQDWTIAFWHHPPYSKGSHDSDRELQLVQMRESALPILEAAGVDLVLSGHSHSYERSFLLDGHYGLSSTLSPAMKRDGGDGRLDGAGAYAKPSLGAAAHEGAVYVVAGSSGQTSGGSLDHPAMFLSLNTHGSLVLDVDRRRLDATFLDENGAVRDRFTLIKGPPNAPPVAAARAVSQAECESHAGAVVRLDGSGSIDPDADEGGGIVTYEWLEASGTGVETPLGGGAVLDVTLAPGVHAVTLRVTDALGASATDDLTVNVVDSVPPALSLALEPDVLWPPDHRLRRVRARLQMSDACDASPRVRLVSVTSSEPDDAPGLGDGATLGDIRGARLGTRDTFLVLRAERAAEGPGRVYTVIYTATDAAGLTATTSATVLVPHDAGPGAGPVAIGAEATGGAALEAAAVETSETIHRPEP